jgi:Fe-S-cluster-containing hydrogenase component 2
MTKTSKNPETPSDLLSDEMCLSRRDFIGRLVVGGGSLILLSGCARWSGLGADAQTSARIYEFIAVDYTKCTGCRTCEAVCSAANHPVSAGRRRIPGLGNPALAHIHVHSFNPDVSAPAVCARCADTPCVNACPVDPDAETGRRAIYRQDEYGTIVNDPNRCIRCGACVEACKDESVGILAQHPETGRPMRMCTLCHGDPQCVRHCPYEALSLIRVTADYPYYRMSPQAIAEELNKIWYDLS